MAMNDVGRERAWRRYVAIGDSTTEGLDDRDERGLYRGWADRLARHIANHQGRLQYANLAIRGRTTDQIAAQQLPVALKMKPDLVTVVAGMNDILAPSFEARAVAAKVEAMFQTFAKTGATVLTFTLPDPTPNLPLTWHFQPRLIAFNEEIRLAATRVGAVLVDFGTFPDQSDPRLWSADRLHGNSHGHAVVARALAHGLGLPGFDGSWPDPLPPITPPPIGQAVFDQLAWAHEHALPWLWRTVRGRSVGDGLKPKRPRPLPVRARR